MQTTPELGGSKVAFPLSAAEFGRMHLKATYLVGQIQEAERCQPIPKI